MASLTWTTTDTPNYFEAASTLVARGAQRAAWCVFREDSGQWSLALSQFGENEREESLVLFLDSQEAAQRIAQETENDPDSVELEDLASSMPRLDWRAFDSGVSSFSVIADSTLEEEGADSAYWTIHATSEGFELTLTQHGPDSDDVYTVTVPTLDAAKNEAQKVEDRGSWK